MAELKKETTDKPEVGSKPADTPKDGAQSQRDEAKDEGVGKLSVPIEEVTTANDK